MSSGAEKKQTTRFASLLRYASLRSADASLQGRLLLHLSTYVIVPYIYSLRPSNHHRIWNPEINHFIISYTEITNYKLCVTFFPSEFFCDSHSLLIITFTKRTHHNMNLHTFTYRSYTNAISFTKSKQQKCLSNEKVAHDGFTNHW